MAKYLKIIFPILLLAVLFVACHKDAPIDGDGLLVTTRQECYVSNIELLGVDYVTVRTKAPVIDTTAQTIAVEVLFGTDLKNIYPQFSLATDCKLDPKIVGKVDFSDLANPKKYTVISGDRNIKKTYTLNITVAK